MRRRVLNFLTVVSLLLGVAACVLWVRSRWVYDRAVLTGGGRHVAAISTCDFVTVFCTALPAADPARGRGWSLYHHQTRDFGRSLFTTEWSRHHAVVRLPGLEVRRAANFVELAVTWPLVTLAAATLPLSRLAGRTVRRARRRLRRHTGRCPACGYDLTANVSGVCPECGGAVSVKRNG